MSEEATYQVYAYVGENPPVISSGIVANVTPKHPTATAALEAVQAAGLNSSDLRSRVVFLVEPSLDGEAAAKAVLAYAAMIGLARRRIDVAFGPGTKPIIMAQVDSAVKALGESSKPSSVADLVTVDSPELDLPDSHRVLAVELADGVTHEVVTSVRYAKRAVIGLSSNVEVALPQFIMVAAMRARGERERLPFISVSGEMIDTDAVRQECELLRSSLRGDNRLELHAHLGPVQEYAQMHAASEIEMGTVLARLGAVSKTVTTEVLAEDGQPTGNQRVQILWHCLHPENHTNGDANPSARVTASENGKEYFRCYKCLGERVDALRLVMWAKDLTGDEAAVWMLSN
jgi:hypothetical protein